MAKFLGAVLVGERLFVGELEDLENKQDSITLVNALELRDMLIPTQGGQMQRMVQFTQVLPFDKTSHQMLIAKYNGVVKIEPDSETQKHYDATIMQLRTENIGIEIAPAGAGFGGKLTPSN